jgi:hypothetical protein
MIDNQLPSEKHQLPANPGKGKDKNKKLYKKPVFRHEQVFETQALSCGKVGANPSGCQLNQKTS